MTPENSYTVVVEGAWRDVKYQIIQEGETFVFEYKPGSKAESIVVVNKYEENGKPLEKIHSVMVSSREIGVERMTLAGKYGSVRMATEAGLKPEPIPNADARAFSSPEIPYGKKPVNFMM